MYNINTEREIPIAVAKFLIELLFSKRLVEKLVLFFVAEINTRTRKNNQKIKKDDKKVLTGNIKRCII